MRPIIYTIPAVSANAVALAQQVAASGAVQLNGALRNYTLLTNGVQQVNMPGIQRTVTITSTDNISTSTFTITGVDILGRAVSTSITGPNNSTASTAVQFAAVTLITVGTAATSNFTVGSGPGGVTNWATMDYMLTPFNVAVSCVVLATTNSVTIQDTSGDPGSSTFATTQIFTHPTLSALTTSTQGSYAYPVRYIRATFTSATADSSVTITQAGLT